MAPYVNGSAAVKLGQEAEVLETPSRARAPRLTVLPGNGGSPKIGAHAAPRARERAEHVLSPLMVTAFKCIAAFVAVLLIASIGRVLLVSLAYGFTSSNHSMITQLDDARSLGSELEVQQSVYGARERVVSLATDVYGMVPATSTAVVDVTEPVVTAEAADGTPTAQDDGAQQTE